MRQRITCSIVLVLVALSSFVPAGGAAGIAFRASKARYLDSEDVVLRLANNTSERIELFGGAIRDRATGEKIGRLEPKRRYLPPDSTHDWIWSHGGRVGRFAARMNTSAGRFNTRFQVGAYFTLGFDGSEDTFVIYVHQAKPIRHLREDLTRPQEERRIVSGIVRREMPYNDPWSYSMGSGSIILADVWMEVCDANPRYVERHRKEWMGKRWCPWSSYVAFEGR